MKELLNIRAVVFDFDGTLAHLNIDFMEMRRDILDLAATFGISEEGMERLFVLEMITEIRDRIGRTNSRQAGAFSVRALGLVSDRELAGAVNSRLFPGVKEMFVELKRRGIKTGILTRNCIEAVTVIFPDVRSYCDAVVTRDDTSRVKPDPEHIHIVLRRLNEEARLAAMVGDHPMDILVGKGVGAFAIGVLTGYSNIEDLKGAGAEMILERVAEITNYLG